MLTAILEKWRGRKRKGEERGSKMKPGGKIITIKPVDCPQRISSLSSQNPAKGSFRERQPKPATKPGTRPESKRGRGGEEERERRARAREGEERR